MGDKISTRVLDNISNDLTVILFKTKSFTSWYGLHVEPFSPTTKGISTGKRFLWKTTKIWHLCTKQISIKIVNSHLKPTLIFWVFSLGVNWSWLHLLGSMTLTYYFLMFPLYFCGCFSFGVVCLFPAWTLSEGTCIYWLLMSLISLLCFSLFWWQSFVPCND